VAPAVHKANEYRDDIFFPDANTTFVDRLEAATVVGGVPVLVAGAPTIIVKGVAYASTVGTIGAAACADGDCTNEARLTAPILQRARIIYDATLGPSVGGATDKYGNIRINPYIPRAERLHTLYHEQVHAFLTPYKGPFRMLPFKEFRATLSQNAYWNSYVLRYAEEAIAEGRANLLTGHSIKDALMHPFYGYGITPQLLAQEAALWIGTAIGGGYGAAELWKEITEK
jgi:hypothetical protein